MLLTRCTGPGSEAVGHLLGLACTGKIIFTASRARDQPPVVCLQHRVVTCQTVGFGGKPRRLPIPGAELTITSDEALELAERPKKITGVSGVRGSDQAPVSKQDAGGSRSKQTPWARQLVPARA